MRKYGIISLGANAPDELELWTRRLSHWQNSQGKTPVPFTTDMLTAQRELCVSLAASGRYLVRYYDVQHRLLQTVLVHAAGAQESWLHIKEQHPDAQLIGVMGHKLQGAL